MAKWEVFLFVGEGQDYPLFFTDDNLIFYKATPDECTALQRVLKVYEKASE